MQQAVPAGLGPAYSSDPSPYAHNAAMLLLVGLVATTVTTASATETPAVNPGTAPPVNRPCSECWDGKDYSTRCWVVLWAQLGVGILLCTLAQWMQHDRGFKEDQESMYEQDEAAKGKNSSFNLLTAFGRNSGAVTESEGVTVDRLPGHERERKQAADRHDGASNTVKRTKKPRTMSVSHRDFVHATFLSHTRDVFNFMSDSNPDLMLPPKPTQAEAIVLTFSRSGLYRFFFSTHPIPFIIVSSIGIACMSGALATWLWIYKSGIEYRIESGLSASASSKSLDSAAVALQSVYGNFQFFPTFMVIGYLGFVVAKWQKWLRICHAIQGKSQSIALMVGSHITDPSDAATRFALFHIWRYLSLVNFVCYKSLSQPLRDCTPDNLIALGLLTEDEADILVYAGAKQRELILGWLGSDLNAMVTKGQLKNVHSRLVKGVDKLRGVTADFHDLFVQHEPNSYTSIMVLVTDVLLLVAILAFPVQFMIYTAGGTTTCFQIWVVLSVFLTLIAYRCSMSLITLLRNPFADQHSHWHDSFRLDTLMSSSDLTNFVSLRSSFDDGHRRRPREAWTDVLRHMSEETRKVHSFSCPPPDVLCGVPASDLAKHSDQEQRERRGSSEITGRKDISLGDFKDDDAARSHDRSCRPSDRVGGGAFLERRVSRRSSGFDGSHKMTSFRQLHVKQWKRKIQSQQGSFEEDRSAEPDSEPVGKAPTPSKQISRSSPIESNLI